MKFLQIRKNPISKTHRASTHIPEGLLTETGIEPNGNLHVHKIYNIAINESRLK